jgi:hypothetical protein
MTLLRERNDPYYKAAGRQVGKERAAIDRVYKTVRDPATLWIPENANLAWVEGLREGYAENLLARDPIVGAIRERLP